MALRFIKRHPKWTAALLFGGFVGGGYLLYRRIKNQLINMSQQMQHSNLENARKRHHFQSNLQTADARIFTLSLSLKDKLLQLADVEFLVRQLREGGADKDVLWENLKITSFTRLITATYLLSGLALLTRMELNLIGGMMYKESVWEGQVEGRGDPDRDFLLKGKDELQKRYLEFGTYVIETGCERLLAAVEAVVRRVLNRFSIKQVINFAEFDQILEEVKASLEEKADNWENINLRQLFLPIENPDSDKDLDLLLNYTRDILDQDFLYLLSSCVKTCFLYISRWTAAQCPETTKDGTITDAELRVQIARLVISISKCFETLFADNQESILHQLLMKREVFTFSQHIYEAFSS